MLEQQFCCRLRFPRAASIALDVNWAEQISYAAELPLSHDATPLDSRRNQLENRRGN